MNQNELYHYGVLGMKWGVRKNRSESPAPNRMKKQKKNISEDARVAKELKKKKVSEMSNAELRKLNERQQLERSYSQLNKSTIAKGLAFVSSAAVMTNTAINLYNNSSKLIEIGKRFVN